MSDVEFQVNQIYALDCIVSSGDGKPKQSDDRITVFKRQLDVNFDLKTKLGRQFFSTLNKQFPTFAFSLRSFEDETVRFCKINPPSWQELEATSAPRTTFLNHTTSLRSTRETSSPTSSGLS